jgi:cobalt-zinc-cadmium efflux system outer membrane protein
MQYDAIRTRFDGDVAVAWLGLEAVCKTIRIVEQRQVPSACLSVETAASGFQAGTTEIDAVIDAECRLPAVKFELLKLKVDEQARYAELERLARGSL